MTEYRRDIDGLRAIAVLSVVLFHINNHLLAGGFVGVDIFFVISGYLISRNILTDLSRNSFSLLTFYSRRVKRIAPAMFAVILCCLLLGQAILLPEDAVKLAKSALWSAASLANVYFWLYQDLGYFAAASAETPLLHLWSLGVEEQFYLIWPLALMLMHRFGAKRGMPLLIIATCAASYVLGQLLYYRAPSFAYFMLPTRVGELLIGALAAISINTWRNYVLPPRTAQLLAYVGAFSIFLPLLLLSEAKPFPGFNAIPPTLGAVLLIWTGHFNRESLVHRFLGLKPMVWVGTISYSAYLWHWPLLAFYRYGRPEVTPVAGLWIFGLTIALGFLSYRYIETPFRHSDRPPAFVVTRWFVAPFAATVLLCFIALGIKGQGLEYFSLAQKDGPAVKVTETRPQDPYVSCMEWHIKPEVMQSKRCIAGAQIESGPRVLLWGDSNADHYIGMLDVFGKQSGFSFRHATPGACPPLSVHPAPFTRVTVGYQQDMCAESLQLIRSELDKYDVVILSASWPGYQERSSNFYSVIRGLVQQLSASGKHVILLAKVPAFLRFDPRCEKKAIRYPNLDCRLPPEKMAPEIQEFNDLLHKLALEIPNVRYFDPSRYLCPDGLCSVYGRDGNALFRDRSHLSKIGSIQLGEEIVRLHGVPRLFSDIPGLIAK